MDTLKLLAVDQEDLKVLSACMQDAVLKIGDMAWLPKENRFALVANRFVWEQAIREAKGFERRRTGLQIARVKSAKTSHIDREAKDAVLSLLAITFEEADTPSGTVSLHFSGGGAIALDVECLEVSLSDLGGAWSTDKKPHHALEE
jgi:hypothetical protein